MPQNFKKTWNPAATLKTMGSLDLDRYNYNDSVTIPELYEHERAHTPRLPVGILKKTQQMSFVAPRR